MSSARSWATPRRLLRRAATALDRRAIIGATPTDEGFPGKRVELSIRPARAARIETSLLRPYEEGERTGVRVALTLRADIRKRPRSVETYLTRIAESILVHPEWRGRIAFVTVVHAARPKVSVTRFAAPEADKAP